MLKPLMDNKEKYLFENFRLTDQLPKDGITLGKLLNERTLMHYLNEISDDLGTDSVFVAASQFMKRMGYILTVPFLYSLTILDKKLTDHLSDSLIVSKVENQKWMPNLYISEDSRLGTSIVSLNTRKEVINELFEQITLLIDKVAKVSLVPKSILWENVAIYVYWLYETKLKEAEFLIYQHQIEQDFSYILHEMSAEIFQQHHNPIEYFHSQRQQNDEESSQPRMRKTCCFYYKTSQSNGKFCGGCPKKCHMDKW